MPIDVTPSAFPRPERSPLEPSRSYGRRTKKWRIDNAKWEGQKRAILRLDKKMTPVPPALDPKIFP